MDVLTIAEAAQTTGWSARMLRYIEQTGLVVPRRSDGGYRLYGPAQVQRLRSLRALVTTYDIGLAELAFVARLQAEPELGVAVDEWFAARPARPEEAPETDWLRFEQEKHERLLTHHTN
ncbi:MAG: MerR family transcriptional regulator [Geodermatophilaceae bacterium]|nr:MerR family transcriptional regulator [Geodermatophilaceae bacterium]